MLKLPYKKLLVWQKSVELSIFVYKFSKKFPREEVYGLTNQMRRAAVSIPSNIAEGSQRSTNKDFSHFLSMARGSLAELETQLSIAIRLQYCSEIEATKLQQTIEELSKMLRSLHSKLFTTH